MSNSSIGRLSITRRAYQSFCLLLEPQVDQKLTAHELFHTPVWIAILPGRSKKQTRVLVEADKRINVLREELKNPKNKKTMQTLTDATLAEIFMDIAHVKLPEKEFNYLQYLAQHQMTRRYK